MSIVGVAARQTARFAVLIIMLTMLGRDLGDAARDRLRHQPAQHCRQRRPCRADCDRGRFPVERGRHGNRARAARREGGHACRSGGPPLAARHAGSAAQRDRQVDHPRAGLPFGAGFVRRQCLAADHGPERLRPRHRLRLADAGEGRRLGPVLPDRRRLPHGRIHRDLRRQGHGREDLGALGHAAQRARRRWRPCPTARWERSRISAATG